VSARAGEHPPLARPSQSLSKDSTLPFAVAIPGKLDELRRLSVLKTNLISAHALWTWHVECFVFAQDPWNERAAMTTLKTALVMMISGLGLVACGGNSSENRVLSKAELTRMQDEKKTTLNEARFKKIEGVEFNRLRDAKQAYLGEMSLRISEVDGSPVYTLRINHAALEPREERAVAKWNSSSKKRHDLILGQTALATFSHSPDFDGKDDEPTCVTLKVNPEAPLFKDVELPKHGIVLCRFL
jgi:hypothetical protein